MDDELTRQLLDETGKLIDQFKLDLMQILRNDRKLKNDSSSLNSLEIVINESSRYVILEAVDYIYYVINGRAPGRFPPPLPDGTWLPYPVGKEIAEKGTKIKYAPVAKAFNELYDKLIEDVNRQAGDISLAYIKRFISIRTT
jgi:hypothetical protein